MKSFLMTLWSLSFCMLVFSCSTGEPEGLVAAETATIMLEPPTPTKSLDAADDVINTFRILLFKTTGAKNLVYNQVYDMSVDQNPIRLDINVDTYDFLFIANEHVDLLLEAELTSLSEITKITDMESKYFSSSSFDAGSDIPMSGVVRGVKILVTNNIEVAGNPISGDWDISQYLKRAAVRVDLTLKSSLASGARFQRLEISNIPDKVYLLSQTSAGTYIYNNGTYEATKRVITEFDPLTTEEQEKAQGSWMVKKNRIILPSSMFAPQTTSANAILFKAVMENSAPLTTTLGLDEPWDYTAPRNYYFKLIGTLSHTIDVKTTAALWNEVTWESSMGDLEGLDQLPGK